MLVESEIANERKEAAETEIRKKQKTVNYTTIEYPVEVLVQKYGKGEDDENSELFIPDYQREMTWDEDRQSKFIESMFLGLPIPYIFVADIGDEDNDLGRLEIIDGTQRIRTLARFLNNELRLNKLEKIESLNGFTFSDLPFARQRRFNRISLRMIQLTEDTDEEVRRDIFERINTGSVELNPMEKRRGIYPGAFLNLIEELSKNPKFLNLCLFSKDALIPQNTLMSKAAEKRAKAAEERAKAAVKRREPQEFILRFFAFLNNYENFDQYKKIDNFLSEYLKKLNPDEKDPNFDYEKMKTEFEKMKTEFETMIDFVGEYFPNGFRQGKYHDRTTTRIKFESLAVGIALALRENSKLQPKSLEWFNSEEFKEYTKSKASSSKNKVKQRIEYVRDQLLGES